MLVSLNDICHLMEEIAPLNLAEDWDNVGLMLGRRSSVVKRILLALDMTEATVNQAIEHKVDLIITHHPAIFRKLNCVTDNAWQQELLLRLAENGIAIYSAHTNLDCVQNGVNDALAHKLQLEDVDILDNSNGLGRIGFVEECALQDFAGFVKKQLKADYVTVGDAGKPVHKVAICGGAGSDLIALALSLGADTLVTGDVKYHSAQEAVFSGMNIIDAGHQPTELPILEELADRLSLRFTERSWNVNIMVAHEELLLKSI